MTEVSNPIVQAVHDAVEAAIAATAAELSQAVGFAGPVTADDIRHRVEQLKDTIRQYLHWTSAAIPVMNAACAVRDDPARLPALIAAVDQYQARPVQPEPLSPYILPAPSPWLNAIDEAIAALDSGDDRYGEEIAGLERLRAELAGEGAPEIDAVWPKWPDVTEQLWASLLAQADAEPDLMTRGADDRPDIELEIVGERPAEIEVIIAQDRELSVFSLCDPDHVPLACLIFPIDRIDDSLIAQLETQAAHYGQIVIEDQGTDRADTPAHALDWIGQANHRLGLAPTSSEPAPESCLADYLCVFFADAPDQPPVALFDRAAFAHDFMRANPGRFREEDPAQDWIHFGEWRRRQKD